MSLVTLEINDVADVIDEAITRHVLVSHNDNKASKLFSDLLSFKSDLQELKTRIGEDNRFDEVKSYIEVRISTMELNISSLKDLIEKYKKIEDKLEGYTSSDRFTKELAYLREDVDREKANVSELVLKRIDELRESIIPLVRDEVSRIPLPKDGEPGRDGVDGNSFTLEDVSPFIVEKIVEEVAKIPMPRDGDPGEPGKDGTSVDFDDIKSFIIDEISKIPLPQDGKDGISIDLDIVHQLIKKEVESISIPVPKDGKSITVEDVIPFIKEEIEKSITNLPLPKDGKPGIDGISVHLDDLRSIITEEVAKLPVPLDGKDGIDGTNVDLDDLRILVENEVAKIPLPKDGKSFTIDDVSSFVTDLIDKKFSSVSIPDDGVDGKDGVGIAGAIIDRDGNLVVTCTNGLTIPLGAVVGKDGIDGKNVDSSELDDINMRLNNIARYVKPFDEVSSRIKILEDRPDRGTIIELAYDKIETIERQIDEMKKSRPRSDLTDDEFARRVAVAIVE